MLTRTKGRPDERDQRHKTDAHDAYVAEKERYSNANQNINEDDSVETAVSAPHRYENYDSNQAAQFAQNEWCA